MLNVNFNAYGKYTTDHLYQWDRNRVLAINGLTVESVPEIHYTNSAMEKAIVRQATMKNGAITADIPNSVLQYPLAIYAYVGVYVGAQFKTIEKIKIPVVERQRPADYVIESTDGEIYSFAALENAIAQMATKAQVANIIAHNNDTDGNTELVDIRTDISGNVHASAGEAVRSQFSNVKNNLESSEIELTKTIVPIEGYYIQNLGKVFENESYAISEPITVPSGYKVRFTARGYKTQVAMISELNADGTYTMLVESINSEDNTYTYTTDKDITLVFSWSMAGECDLKVGVNISALRAAMTNTIADSLVNAKNENIAEDFVSLSLFSNFGVIGDSYASGEMYYGGSFHDVYPVSWGQILARKLGTNCVNFSAGGMSTKGWLASDKGLSLMLATDPQDIYYLALGINDANNYGADYLGTIDDVKDDYAQNTDTFYGNYGKIIGNIRTHAPNAKIVMFTVVPTTDMKATYNDAIINIANHFGIPYIVQTDDPFFNSDFYVNGKVQSHPVAIVYSGMAKAFERLIKRCILNNVEYFNDAFMY